MRILDKITELEKYLDEYSSIKPRSPEELASSLEKKAVGERYFEKIVECATDLAFIIISHYKFQEPTDDLSAFQILFESKVISKPTCEALKEAKRMRNFIVHNYGEVKSETIFNALDSELPRDIASLITEVENYMKTKK